MIVKFHFHPLTSEKNTFVYYILRNLKIFILFVPTLDDIQR